MEIFIKGTAKEIADLALALQDRHVAEVDENTIARKLATAIRDNAPVIITNN